MSEPEAGLRPSGSLGPHRVADLGPGGRLDPETRWGRVFSPQHTLSKASVLTWAQGDLTRTPSLIVVLTLTLTLT